MDRPVGFPLRRGVKIALVAFGIGVGLWLVAALKNVVVMVLFATTLAAGMEPIVERIHRARFLPGHRHLPRGFVILALFLGILLVVVALLSFVTWVGWSEGRQLVGGMSVSEKSVLAKLEKLHQAVPALPGAQEMLDAGRAQFEKAGQYLRKASAFVFNLFGIASSIFLVMVLALYMLLNKESIRGGFLALIPPKHQEFAEEVAGKVLHAMGGWLRGQLLLVALMGTVVAVAMMLFGMPYPFLMGIVGAFGELVPMVGPIAAGFVVIPIALFTKPPLVTGLIVAFFLVLSLVEGNYVVPKVMQANVKLPPFFTVLAILAGGTLVGPAGALLAIPVAAGLKVLLRELAVPKIQRAGAGSSS